MKINTELFQTHGEAWARYCALTEDVGVLAQLKPGGEAPWVITYWTREEAAKEA